MAENIITKATLTKVNAHIRKVNEEGAEARTVVTGMFESLALHYFHGGQAALAAIAAVEAETGGTVKPTTFFNVVSDEGGNTWELDRITVSQSTWSRMIRVGRLESAKDCKSKVAEYTTQVDVPTIDSFASFVDAGLLGSRNTAAQKKARERQRKATAKTKAERAYTERKVWAYPTLKSDKTEDLKLLLEEVQIVLQYRETHPDARPERRREAPTGARKAPAKA